MKKIIALVWVFALLVSCGVLWYCKENPTDQTGSPN